MTYYGYSHGATRVELEKCNKNLLGVCWNWIELKKLRHLSLIRIKIEIYNIDCICNNTSSIFS